MDADYNLNEGEVCLGELTITDIQISSQDLVTFQVESQKQPNQRYLVTAVYSGKEWYLYWPEPLIRALH